MYVQLYSSLACKIEVLLFWNLKPGTQVEQTLNPGFWLIFPSSNEYQDSDLNLRPMFFLLKVQITWILGITIYYNLIFFLGTKSNALKLGFYSFEQIRPILCNQSMRMNQ